MLCLRAQCVTLLSWRHTVSGAGKEEVLCCDQRPL